MNRAEYRTHRAAIRNIDGIIKRARTYASMADSTNNVQRLGEESTHAHLRMMQRQHEAAMPRGGDPLGFRAMACRRDEQRKRVQYRARMRQFDAEQRARFPAYFARKEA